jgi:magnesium chelatase subunit H
MAPCLERVDALVEKTHALATLRRKSNADKTVGIVLFGFPPNAGAVGTAAYLSVFESLHNTLHRMQAEGYDVTPPATVDALRDAVLNGNAQVHGQEANVAATVTADKIVTNTPWLDEIEATWGAAPAVFNPTGARCLSLARNSARSWSACSPPSDTRAIPCAFCSKKGSRPPTRFPRFINI